MKETQDRTRKRIKEDIKDSTLAYQEYADHNLPRAKRAYLKKCQEVEVGIFDVVMLTFLHRKLRTTSLLQMRRHQAHRQHWTPPPFPHPDLILPQTQHQLHRLSPSGL